MLPNPRLTLRLLAAVFLASCAAACAPPLGQAACASLPSAPAPTSASPTSPTSPPAPTAAGTWLFQCCDGASTWVGMVTLVEEARQLHGAWLTDGDSHGSYIDGQRDGSSVHFSRRWRTGAVLHEQTYELTLSADAQQLSGSFREPAFDPAPHTLQLQRGFSKEPRRPSAPAPSPTPAPDNEPVDLDPPGKRKAVWQSQDAKRPCDCALVCYCGGVPPGPEHYAESARCGGSCKCSVCPPLP